MLLFCSPSSWAATACQVSYKIPNQWGNGFTGDVTLTNLGDAWKNWTVTWDMPNGQKVTGLWNGNVTQTGAAVKVTNVSWNGSVAKNATAKFGFNGSHTGTNNIPTNVSVNGVLCSGNAAPPKPPVVACDVKYSLVTEWDTGYTADVSIKNTGDVVSDWTVAWDMPDSQQVIGMWNGVYKQTFGRVDVTNAGWNRVVTAGSTLQFGFNGLHFGLNRVPGNISLNGVKCTGQVDPPPPPPPSCEVKYQIQTQWDTGFTGTVDIKNTGVPWNTWRTTWTMPTGQQVTSGWNAQISQTNDKVTAGNVDSNKIIRQNGSISFGFNASHTGLNIVPIDVAVNGTRCNGQADKLVLPPKAPTPLQGSLVDNSYVNLTWQDNSTDEANMVLERRENAGNWAVLATLAADTVTYQDKTLVIGSTYEYRVKAANSAGASAYTNTLSFKRQDRTDIRAVMLVNNCASCHGTDGYSTGPGIPSIAGLNKNYLVKTMKAYRSGERYSSVMGRVAKGYNDTQIDRMSDYLSKLTFKAATQTTTQALVNRGKAVHESNCVFCHAGTGNDTTLTGTRLDGQWSTYLHATLEDYNAGRSSNMPVEMANQMKNLKTLFGDDVLLALAQYYAADATAKAGGDTGGGNSGGGTGGGGSGGDPGVAPVTPTAMTATVVDNSKVNLSWKDNSNNETGFRVERRAAGASDTDWASIAELGSNTQAYTDTNVVMGAGYDYRVFAFNAVGSTASTVATASLSTALQYGQTQYQRQGCASCHGADGQGGFTKISLTKYSATDLANLTKIIHDTMPPGNPGACSGACASTIASYITDVLTPAANGGNGGGTTQACQGTPPAGIRSLRLLTRLEYQNTVNDLFGLSLNLVNSLPDENQVGGFDNNIAQNQVSSLRMDAYLTQAEKVAAQAVLNSWSKIVPCTQQDTACARQFIQTFGKRTFRRPLTTAEVDTFATNFNAVAFKDAVEKTVMAMLVSPNFLYRSELGELQADGTYKLTPYEVASSLSYLFWGSMPDDALFQAADQNALDTPAQRISHASRLLAAARSRQQVGNFVGQWLLKASPFSLPSKDATVYPAYTDAVKAALSQELINFFNYVTFDSTQSFRELYTADYVIANKTLADFYHLSGPTGSAFEKTPVTDGTRSGLLTLGSVLARYANSNESHPFKRGRFFFERILCHDLPEPANFGLVQPPDPDPNMTTRQRFDFHSKAFPSCYSCHQYLDGPGFGFENYDGAGQYRQTENGNVISASAILRGMETYTPTEELTFTDLNNLSQLVADSPTAAQCVARQYYRYTTGHQETAADQCALDSYLQTYKDNGYNLQTMLLSIVNAPNFTSRRAQ
jgi:cytochrome c553